MCCACDVYFGGPHAAVPDETGERCLDCGHPVASHGDDGYPVTAGDAR